MVFEGDIVGLIGSVGFPIVVALWFMVRTEKVIKANTSALGAIREVMVSCKKK